MGAGNFEYVSAALHDPLTVRAMLEDYRAGLGIDVEHDRDDLARGRRITCPTLVAWSMRDDMEELYGDLVPLWRPWVSAPITRARVDSGHHLAEENPHEVARVIADFLARSQALRPR
jgi:haloacetate dehalogenase